MKLFEREELNLRIERLLSHMAQHNVEVALISTSSDLFYFTGSIQKGLLVITQKQDPMYFVRKNKSRAELESPLDIRDFNKTAISELLSYYKTVGMTFDQISAAELQFYQKRIIPQHVTVSDISFAVALTKMIKSEQEISLIEKAGEINQQVMTYCKSIYTPGMTDYELQVDIESYARKELGHQGLFKLRGVDIEGGISLVVTGTSALKPTYTDFPIGGEGLNPSISQGAAGEVIKKSFVVDFIGAHKGYNADSTRTFFIGQPQDTIIKTYQELNALLCDVEQQVGIGKTGEEVYQFCMERVESFSWKDGFMGLAQKVKFIGHGIGTEVNQLPVIAPRQKIPFAKHMMIAIEPKIFIEDYGIIGIENTYLITADGPISITGDSKEISDFVI